MSDELALSEEFDQTAPEIALSQRSRARRGSLSLLKAFLNDTQVGSVAPSSGYLCRAVASHIDPVRSRSIVELGAGDGVLTSHLLDRVAPQCKIVAFETNPSLAELAEERCEDPRLEVITNSAEELETVCNRKAIAPDAIVSGIPFSFLSAERVEAVIAQCRSVLQPKGRLVIYQMWLPFFKIHGYLFDSLSRHFRTKPRELVLLNVPPLQIIVCTPRPR